MKYRNLGDVVTVARENEDDYIGTIEPWDGGHRYVHNPERGSIRSLSGPELSAIAEKIKELDAQ